MTSDLYYGLLTNPPGLYGLTPYSHTYAVSLTGTPEFRERAFNLFASFGADCDRGYHLESRVPALHKSERPDTEWFCMPKDRVVQAIRLYLYGQLYAAKGERAAVVDSEGDFTEMVHTNEDALMAEASELAATFVAIEMTPDNDALPTYARAREEVAYAVARGFGGGNDD